MRSEKGELLDESLFWLSIIGYWNIMILLQRSLMLLLIPLYLFEFIIRGSYEGEEVHTRFFTSGIKM